MFGPRNAIPNATPVLPLLNVYCTISFSLESYQSNVKCHTLPLNMPLLDPWSAVEKRPPINEHFILVNSTFTIFFAIRRRRVESHLGNTSPFKKSKRSTRSGS